MYYLDQGINTIEITRKIINENKKNITLNVILKIRFQE